MVLKNPSVQLGRSMNSNFKVFLVRAGPIAKRSKLSDRGRGDLGSNPGEGRFFSAFFQDGELS